MADALSRQHLAGDGHYTAACSSLLASALGAPSVLLTTSCTHALEMSAILLRVREGDEVIVPSFTFVSTANAFALRGARIIFCDVRPDTLNLDEAQLERCITPRTKAIVVMHYAGVGCEMDTIMEIAARRNVPVVEDNAHGLFARYRSRNLGTFGALATQSFHETKNFTCGEGGALVVNEPAFEARAAVLRDKGTNRRAFVEGLVDKYTWVDLGSSYPPADILMAFLYAQLERRDEVQARRRRLWDRYHELLHPWAAERGAQLPFVPPHCEQAYHLYYLLLPEAAGRPLLMSYLRERDILAIFHYHPLHASSMGRAVGSAPFGCPVTDDVSARLLRLPFYTSMTDDEQDRVIGALMEFV
ncbi:MAG: dTDP-4-amino-4,6-dideoxygalactose transaminase [Gemmatimonadaceae bacterium]|nr:dTDP-4-amino-4,6-dideoxygalactose transaminase [Gemmatimonadaceae bacterium]